MPTISEILRAELLDAPALRARLEALGFVETARPSPPPRKPPTRGAASLGVAAPTARAEKLLEGLASSPRERAALLDVVDDVLAVLSESADPLIALLNFSHVSDAAARVALFRDESETEQETTTGDRAAWYEELKNQPALRARVCRLLSWSQSLADTLIQQPELLASLRQPPQSVSRPALRTEARATTACYDNAGEKMDALRRFRRRQTLRIGLLDMERQTWRDEDDFNLVVRQISDLAQVCVQETLRLMDQDGDSPGCDFAVIGMGKLGARELNYSSDIDLIFLHDGDAEETGKLGAALLKALSDSSPGGTLFRVDMRLRPEGKAGPLVTSIGYALSYYESYAAAWEWQALIKARAIAGDARLARRFRRFTRGVAWARRADDAHLREMVESKRRMESTPDGSDVMNVKQGPGAIRDAEWVVQQLQMMVGPSHPPARASATLRAARALCDFAALTPDEERTLREGYLFLRVLEHRLQLWQGRAVRVFAADEAGQAALARRMGFSSRGQAAARTLREEHERHRTQIRALCERAFWSWRGDERMKDEGGGMKDEARGFHPSGFILHPSEDAQRRLRRIAEGSSTHPFPAPLSRQITAALPAALQYVGNAARPELAIANLERLCDASGNRLSLLRALGDAPRLARAVFLILGGSQWLSDTLIHFPQLLDMAAQRPLLARPKSGEEARAGCRDYCLTFRDRKAALRRWKAREMLRIGLRDLVMDAPAPELALEISDLAQACIALACDEVSAARRLAESGVTLAVIGLGKLGGGEMHYSSDADILFVCDVMSGDGAAGISATTGVAEEVMRFVGERTEDGTGFEMDARLRPMAAAAHWFAPYQATSNTLNEKATASAIAASRCGSGRR